MTYFPDMIGGFLLEWMHIVKSIPWWVYLLVFVIGKMAFQATQTKVVPLKKLYIMPAIVVFMAVHNLLIQPSQNAGLIAAWAVAILLGVGIGWKVVSGLELKFDKNNFLVELPGSWSTVILMVLIIASKVLIGYEASVHRELVQQSGFQLLAMGVSGVCTGIIVGRVIGYTYQLLSSESQTIEKVR